jgi:DNA-binding XRE family transcriptional regulator
MLSPASTALGAVPGAALQNRPTSWVDYAPYGSSLSRLPIDLPRSASSKLARIRANLSLKVAELARILRVERPTIYAWMRDASIALRTENGERLDRLEEVALAWERLSKLPVGSLVRQRSDSRESVASLLEAGRNDEAEDLLRAIAASGQSRPARRVASVRETLEKHGLQSKIRSSRDEIDRTSR